MKNTSAMVTTWSNVHDGGQTSNPEATIALLNEYLARMEKNVEDLTTQNAALQARISEQSHTPTIVPPNMIPESREEHNNLINARRKEGESHSRVIADNWDDN